MLNPRTNGRWWAAAPFAILGGAAIIAGGLIAAAAAHQPTQKIVWLSAYLVLIVGVVQCVFGVGQVLLSEQAPRATWVRTEWMGLS